MLELEKKLECECQNMKKMWVPIVLNILLIKPFIGFDKKGNAIIFLKKIKIFPFVTPNSSNQV